MNKKVLYGAEARAKVLDGINKIADAVVTTLGPMGRNVLIAQSIVIDYGVRSLPIHITKDGYNTSKAFELIDPFEQVGVLMAKECAQKSVDQAGDGTSTTILLFRAITEKGIELVNAGANPMELKKGIDKAVEYVVGELDKMATSIKGDIEKIRQIATVSANNDTEIGEWIAKAFEKIGDEGVIDLEASQSVNTEIKIADGYKWNNGWVSPYFINNKEKQITEFNNPLILLYEKRITHHTQIETALRIALQQSRPILIICEDSDEEGLAYLATNNIRPDVLLRNMICVVKSPSFGNDRRIEMEDLAILTGGTFISDTKGVSVQEVEFENFGSAKKIIVSKDETIIIGGNADKVSLENLLNELRMNLAQAKNEDEKLPIEKRIAKLTGGIAVIQVGAATETEMKEKLDRFDDAVRATKAAIAEGYVAGGGTAFISINGWQSGINSEGYILLLNVLHEPLRQLCVNAGVEYAEKIKLLSSNPDSYIFEHNGKGYNVKTDTVEDLVLAGIIDPVKVLRCSLQNAASSATMVLTSEVLICDSLT